MNKLLILILIVCCSFDNPSCAKLDIIILADYSGSIYSYESFIVRAISNFNNKLNLSNDGIRLGIVVFNNSAYTIQKLTGDNKDISNAIVNLNYIKGTGSTALNEGLALALKNISTEREDVKRIIIVISDGAPDSPSKAMEVVNNIGKENILICTVLVNSSEVNKTFMRNISSNCYVETDYNSLSDQLNQLDICL